MTQVDAILPAGGRIHGKFAQEAGASVKCLIEIDGSALLERAVLAVQSTGIVGRTVVIGPDEVASHHASRNADAALQEGRSGPENIRSGLHWLSEKTSRAERVLILTTDLPFIAPAAILGFVERCPENADFCLPIYTRDEFLNAYPGCGAKFVRLQSGEWTTGCAFLVNPVAIESNWKHIERAFAARKSQVAMARLMGAMTIARQVTRRLDIHHVEKRCREILGCTGVAVTGCDPSLAFDIDDARDYHYAHQRPSGRSVSTAYGGAP